jgi:hypothetical protein
MRTGELPHQDDSPGQRPGQRREPRENHAAPGHHPGRNHQRSRDSKTRGLNPAVATVRQTRGLNSPAQRYRLKSQGSWPSGSRLAVERG